MKKPILFFDMDEVIVALSEHIINKYNKTFNDNMKWIDNHNYWWGDCKKADKKFFETLLKEKWTFLNSKPMKGAIEILNKLHNENYDIHIITLPQFNSKYCFQEKVHWIKKYLPYINIETNFHCTGNKGLLAKENRILVDDNLKHLKSWKNNNGISICFSYKNNYEWNKTWCGITCCSWEGIYKAIQNVKEEF